jgi:DNA processing protein
MENKLYWLWLTNIKGIGEKKRGYLIQYFEHPKNIFEASDNEVNNFLNKCKTFSKSDMNNIIMSRNEEKILDYHKKLTEMDIKYTAIDDIDYPTSLSFISSPPQVIYYKGKKPMDNGIKIAIVGARKCTVYGKKIAHYFSKELAKENITVVSGMARGIDTAAHKGALESNGKTIAVLGCGINICYPKENYKVMEQIIKEGTVISEYPINTQPLAGLFPKRNRIISGLCNGILVVEAAKKSGSLITVDFALEQGKDVFSIPGRLFEKMSLGTNHLIQMGAKPVFDIDDILEEYNIIRDKNTDTTVKNKIILEQNEKIVYSCISFEPIYIDDICRKTNKNISEIQLILTKLEFKGIIEQLPNKYFTRSKLGN